MSIETQTMDARTLADDMYDRDAGPEEIKKAAVDLGVARTAFEERLAIRAFLDADDNMPAVVHEPISDGLLDTLRAAYASAGPDLVEAVGRPIEPKAWLSLAASLGGDNGFIAKLARKTVTPPTKRALRDLADMLGVSIARVREHFAAGNPGLGLAGVEMRSSVKPAQMSGETFEGAVRSSSLPPALKNRWLQE